jgi:(1->4)-alpha-D-glucan 1-alpha-D-glucosylmutase
MMPGVPDFYQGTEFWDYSFVDPDNRRPVDFTTRDLALRSIERPDWPNLVQNWQDGRIKLAWTRTLLALRRERPLLFTHGDYRPIRVEGKDSHHVIAFARRHRQEAVIVAVGRHFAGVSERGKNWPTGAIEAALDLTGYKVTSRCSYEAEAGMLQLPIFVHFPAAVLRAEVSPGMKGQSTIRL